MSNNNIPSIPLIMIFIFFFFTISSATAASGDNHFIRETCENLRNRSVNFTSCQQWLLPLAGKLDPRSVGELVKAALQLTINQTNFAAGKITAYISRHGSAANAPAGGALADCKENLDKSKEKVKDSLAEMKRLGGGDQLLFRINNIQTWLSAAETGEFTCTDGLNEVGKKVGAAVNATVQALVAPAVEVTHITLALFNQFANVTNP